MDAFFFFKQKEISIFKNIWMHVNWALFIYYKIEKEKTNEKMSSKSCTVVTLVIFFSLAMARITKLKKYILLLHRIATLGKL